jgi:hypothetical protein
VDIKRKNGDKGVDYLVNDGTLDLKRLINKNVIVFGERHGNLSDEGLVVKLCKIFKPHVVLAEGLGDLNLPDLKSKKAALDVKKEDLYYHGFTQRWIDLSIKCGDVPFRGMEYVDWDGDKLKDMSYKDSFEIREAHFLRLIRKYAKVGKVLAICGDTHMRSIATDVLGPVSPLYSTYIDDPKAAVIRSAEGEIE